MSLKLILIPVIMALMTFLGFQGYKVTHLSPPIERSPAITENRTIVAVLDSGLAFNSDFEPYLCKEGHKDFTGLGLEDRIQHGSSVAKLITYGMSPKLHCLLILKYYSPISFNNLAHELQALEYVQTLDNVKYLNFSAGGPTYSDKEENAIAKLLNKGVKVIVAAGNEGWNFDTVGCNYFPACTNKDNVNMYAIGNCDKNGVYWPTSNFGGPVKHCRNGTNVKVNGIVLTGTSMSTAIFTSELIKQESK